MSFAGAYRLKPKALPTAQPRAAEAAHSLENECHSCGAPLQRSECSCSYCKTPRRAPLRIEQPDPDWR